MSTAVRSTAVKGPGKLGPWVQKPELSCARRPSYVGPAALNFKGRSVMWAQGSHGGLSSKMPGSKSPCLLCLKITSGQYNLNHFAFIVTSQFCQVRMSCEAQQRGPTLFPMSCSLQMTWAEVRQLRAGHTGLISPLGLSREPQARSCLLQVPKATSPYLGRGVRSCQPSAA